MQARRLDLSALHDRVGHVRLVLGLKDAWHIWLGLGLQSVWSIRLALGLEDAASLERVEESFDNHFDCLLRC
jgi:steroid 5-alpha reductase family enzyme